MADLFDDQDPLEFSIPMVTPWSAPKRKGSVYYNPKHAEKVYMQDCIRDQYDGPLLECGIRAFFEFHIMMPKTWSPKKRATMIGELHEEKPDATNCQKLAEDCLQGIVIKDDKKISWIGSVKFWAEHSSTVIKLWRTKGHPTLPINFGVIS